MSVTAGTSRVINPDFRGDDDASSIRTALPPYTCQPGSNVPDSESNSSSYVFHLRTRKNKPWATLEVKRTLGSASSVKKLPIFVEGHPVEGSFTMDLETPDPIRSIELIITGDITTGPNMRTKDIHRFLEHRVCLFSCDPDSSNSGLTGKHQYPFSVHLPKEVVETGAGAGGFGSTPHSFRLPHTLMDRNSPVGVNYYIAIKVSRRRFHTDSKLVTMVSFYTATRPDPPSLLRQQSYREEQPLLGPDVDTTGWQRCSPVKCRGRIFDDRVAEVECSLSVALPLCFTRGTAIPLFISITSQDIQALDLLASPSCIRVHLQRHMRYTDISSTQDRGGSAKQFLEVMECGNALWWPAEASGNSDGEEGVVGSSRKTSRTFAGELRLSKFLQPSCVISYLSITYTLSLQPFQQVGFRLNPEDASASTSSPLIEVPISIATLPAKGPPARCYSPPSYDDTAKRAKMSARGAASWETRRGGWHVYGI